MRLFRFSVAGTNYRALLQEMAGEQALASGIGSRGCFFAFGVGDGPVIGYFFHAADPVAWDYFCEKFVGASDSRLSRRHTLGVGYHTLTTLVTGGVEERGGAPALVDLGIHPGSWPQLLAAAEIR